MIALKTSLGQLAISLLLPVSVFAQAAPSAPEKVPSPPPSTVPVNPRAGADDPRIGLKGGLYDAGEAAFGLERIATLPKPPGFAPGNFIPTAGPAPTPPPSADG